MVRYRLRKDKLINEGKIRYIAYGITVYEDWKKIRIIKDVSFDKKRLAELIKKCNIQQVSPKRIDDIVQQFVDDEYTVDSIKEKPYSLV